MTQSHVLSIETVLTGRNVFLIKLSPHSQKVTNLKFQILFNLILCFSFLFCRGTVLNNNNKGKWFKFNDTVVEEFEMSDTTLEAECFGGTYKAKVYDNSK